MESLLQKQSITVTTPVLDVTQEYVLSGDFILPEYCPDVAVVLKCLVTPRIQSRRFSGGMLTLDGMAVVRILYLDEERRCVREAEFTQPINCSMHAQGDEAPPVAVHMTVDYVNCRAISPRRFEVRGALTTHAVAYRADALELPSHTSDDCLYTKTVEMMVSAPITAAEKMLTISETLDFDSNLPPAEQLLGGDCTAVVNECKLLTGKAIVKGQIYLHQLYTDDIQKGSTYVLDYTLPFSQIMDMDGVSDGQLQTAFVSVLTDTEQCVAGADGKNNALEFTAKLLVQVCVYESTEQSFVLDAYHRDCPVILNKEPLPLRSLVGAFHQTVAVQKSVALPAESLQEIIDAWVQPQSVTGHWESGHPVLTARVLVSLLVRDTDGIVAYYERPEEVQVETTPPLSYSSNMDGCEIQAELSVMGLSYAALGDKLDLRMTLAVKTALWDQMEHQVVKDITLQKEEAYPKDRTALRLYYADVGESVWEIARRCHTSPDGIREENDLREDIFTAKTVLLIPVS